VYKDSYDLEVTCDSDEALQSYLAGIDASLKFDDSGIGDFEQAVAHDENFALAHAALGRQLFIHGRRREASERFKRALSLRPQVTTREQRAIAFVEAATRGSSDALAMATDHVAEWPRDVFVLAHLLGPFGMLAFSGQADWCARNLALLKATQAAYPADDWWHTTTRGFLAAEDGALTEARVACERAWSLNENGNCAHSVAHLHFEACANDEGRTFIKKWLAKYGAHSDMRHHLTWHLALLDIENGASADEVYESCGHELDPNAKNPTPLETVADNASIVWRFHLYQKSISGDILEDQLHYLDTHYPNCGFPFVDLHRAMLTALHPDQEKRDVLRTRLQQIAEKRGSQIAACALSCADAFFAFVNGKYANAVALLESTIKDSVMFGGSNPQRQVVADTYLEACIRSGQGCKARTILQQRNIMPTPFDELMQARTDKACDDH